MSDQFSHQIATIFEGNDKVSEPHVDGDTYLTVGISPSAFQLAHKPNLIRIEIEITTRCNLMCRHCDRRCSQAPANVDLPISAVQQFVNESRALGYRWQKIGLLGGEPTLHPELGTVIAILGDYVRTLDQCEFFLVSNVHGSMVSSILNRIRSHIAVVERPKNSHEPWFNNMDIAPLDVSCSVNSCQITNDCGLGLTSRGYFPCGPGAAISRALDLDIGVKSLRDVTEDSMTALLRLLCPYCGHAVAIPAGVDGGTSSFWKAANERYRARYTMTQYSRGIDM